MSQPQHHAPDAQSGGLPLAVLVVDDEALARKRLRQLLADCVAPAVQTCLEAGDAAQALQVLERQRVDAVLLDIHMPGADGLALAARLRQMPESPAVVFVTAHPEHALQAFELEALDYLTKPVRLERLRQALQKVERSLRPAQRPLASGDAYIAIQERGRTLRVPLAEVLYFKAELKYVTVRTAEREYILTASLGDLEARYSQQFLRIHRNALVARQALRSVQKQPDAHDDGSEAWTVGLNGCAERLAVSRRQVATVREAIAGG